MECEAVSNAVVCRSCGAPVTWAMQKSGKLMPLDPDGTSHFATCPHAAKWRTRDKKEETAP